jgi:hypothetical protein
VENITVNRTIKKGVIMKVQYMLVTSVIFSVTFAIGQDAIPNLTRKQVNFFLKKQRDASFNRQAAQFEQPRKSQFVEIVVESLSKEIDKETDSETIEALVQKSLTLAQLIGFPKKQYSRNSQINYAGDVEEYIDSLADIDDEVIIHDDQECSSNGVKN